MSYVIDVIVKIVIIVVAVNIVTYMLGMGLIVHKGLQVFATMFIITYSLIILFEWLKGLFKND